MTSGASAHAVQELVDAAVERLLRNTQSSSYIAELHQLRAENSQLRASLRQIQEVDDSELSRLWATIEDLQVKLARARQDGRKEEQGDQGLLPQPAGNGLLALPASETEQQGQDRQHPEDIVRPETGSAAITQQPSSTEGIGEIGLHFASLSRQLQDVNSQIQQLSSRLGLPLPVQIGTGRVLVPLGGTAAITLQPGWQDFVAQIDSNIRQQLQEVVMPQLKAEIHLALAPQRTQHASQLAAQGVQRGAGSLQPAQLPQQAERCQKRPRPAGDELASADVQDAQQEGGLREESCRKKSRSAAADSNTPPSRDTGGNKDIAIGTARETSNGSTPSAHPSSQHGNEAMQSLQGQQLSTRQPELARSPPQTDVVSAMVGNGQESLQERTVLRQHKEERERPELPAACDDGKTAFSLKGASLRKPSIVFEPPAPADLGRPSLLAAALEARNRQLHQQQQHKKSSKAATATATCTDDTDTLDDAGRHSQQKQQRTTVHFKKPAPVPEGGGVAELAEQAQQQPQTSPGRLITSQLLLRASQDQAQQANQQHLQQHTAMLSPPPSTTKGTAPKLLSQLLCMQDSPVRPSDYYGSRQPSPSLNGDKKSCSSSREDTPSAFPSWLAKKDPPTPAESAVPVCAADRSRYTAATERQSAEPTITGDTTAVPGEMATLDGQKGGRLAGRDPESVQQPAGQSGVLASGQASDSEGPHAVSSPSKDHVEVPAAAAAPSVAPAPAVEQGQALVLEAAQWGMVSAEPGILQSGTCEVELAAAAASTLGNAVGGDGVGAEQPSRNEGEMEQEENEAQPTIDFAASGFMIGAIHHSTRPEDVVRLPRICPPCSITLPSHDQYLQHMCSDDHLSHAELLCKATTGNLEKFSACQRRVLERLQQQQYHCHACNRTMVFQDFLEHLCGADHLYTVRCALGTPHAALPVKMHQQEQQMVRRYDLLTFNECEPREKEQKAQKRSPTWKPIDFSDQKFMTGAIPRGTQRKALDSLPRICPSCALTLPSHLDYLRHMCSLEHLEQVKAHIKAIRGANNVKLAREQRECLSKAQSSNFYCHVCSRIMMGAGYFLSHLRSRDHLERARQGSGLPVDPMPSGASEHATAASAGGIAAQRAQQGAGASADANSAQQNTAPATGCAAGPESLQQSIGNKPVQHDKEMIAAAAVPSDLHKPADDLPAGAAEETSGTPGETSNSGITSLSCKAQCANEQPRLPEQLGGRQQQPEDAVDFSDPTFMKGAVPSGTPDERLSSLPLTCPPCATTLPTLQSYLRHMFNKQHLKRAEQVLQATRGVDYSALNKQESDALVEVQLSKFYCHVCSRSILGATPFLQHLTAGSHLRYTRQALSLLLRQPQGRNLQDAGWASAPPPPAAATTAGPAGKAETAGTGAAGAIRAGADEQQQATTPSAVTAAAHEQEAPSPLNFNYPEFMLGAVSPRSDWRDLRNRPRICPPCGITLPTHTAYLQHLLAPAHINRCREVFEAVAGRFKSKVHFIKSARKEMLTKYFHCWACQRTILFQQFLHHMQSQKHLSEVRSELREQQVREQQPHQKDGEVDVAAEQWQEGQNKESSWKIAPGVVQQQQQQEGTPAGVTKVVEEQHTEREGALDGSGVATGQQQGKEDVSAIQVDNQEPADQHKKTTVTKQGDAGINSQDPSLLGGCEDASFSAGRPDGLERGSGQKLPHSLAGGAEAATAGTAELQPGKGQGQQPVEQVSNRVVVAAAALQAQGAAPAAAKPAATSLSAPAEADTTSAAPAPTAAGPGATAAAACSRGAGSAVASIVSVKEAATTALEQSANHKRGAVAELQHPAKRQAVSQVSPVQGAGQVLTPQRQHKGVSETQERQKGTADVAHAASAASARSGSTVRPLETATFAAVHGEGAPLQQRSGAAAPPTASCPSAAAGPTVPMAGPSIVETVPEVPVQPAAGDNGNKESSGNDSGSTVDVGEEGIRGEAGTGTTADGGGSVEGDEDSEEEELPDYEGGLEHPDPCDPNFMPGFVPRDASLATLNALPRICPPCGITLSTPKDYLRHLASSGHQKQTQLAFDALAVDNPYEMYREPDAARRVLNQHYHCYACRLTVTCRRFLEHLLCKGHESTLLAELERVGEARAAPSIVQQQPRGGTAAVEGRVATQDIPQQKQQDGPSKNQEGRDLKKASPTANRAAKPVKQSSVVPVHSGSPQQSRVQASKGEGQDPAHGSRPQNEEVRRRQTPIAVASDRAPRVMQWDPIPQPLMRALANDRNHPVPGRVLEAARVVPVTALQTHRSQRPQEPRRSQVLATSDRKKLQQWQLVKLEEQQRQQEWVQRHLRQTDGNQRQEREGRRTNPASVRQGEEPPDYADYADYADRQTMARITKAPSNDGHRRGVQRQQAPPPWQPQGSPCVRQKQGQQQPLQQQQPVGIPANHTVQQEQQHTRQGHWRPSPLAQPQAVYLTVAQPPIMAAGAQHAPGMRQPASGPQVPSQSGQPSSAGVQPQLLQKPSGLQLPQAQAPWQQKQQWLYQQGALPPQQPPPQSRLTVVRPGSSMGGAMQQQPQQQLEQPTLVLVPSQQQQQQQQQQQNIVGNSSQPPLQESRPPQPNVSLQQQFAATKACSPSFAATVMPPAMMARQPQQQQQLLSSVTGQQAWNVQHQQQLLQQQSFLVVGQLGNQQQYPGLWQAPSQQMHNVLLPQSQQQLLGTPNTQQMFMQGSPAPQQQQQQRSGAWQRPQ